MRDLKIGVVIADSDEYIPFKQSVKDLNCADYSYYNKDAVSFELGKYSVVCINCGIGKVNAAAAAAHLADIGSKSILNFGLSGGISGVKRGEVVVPDKFLEHDFDLSAIGYKPCEKPSQKYIYDVDRNLFKIAKSVFGDIACGTAVCGDRFICNSSDRDFLRDTFGATTCDMETAAIASVCDMANIPYLSVRRVSDDAGEDAYSSYKEMNIGEGETLSSIFLKILYRLCEV